MFRDATEMQCIVSQWIGYEVNRIATEKQHIDANGNGNEWLGLGAQSSGTECISTAMAKLGCGGHSIAKALNSCV